MKRWIMKSKVWYAIKDPSIVVTTPWTLWLQKDPGGAMMIPGPTKWPQPPVMDTSYCCQNLMEWVGGGRFGAIKTEVLTPHLVPKSQAVNLTIKPDQSSVIFKTVRSGTCVVPSTAHICWPIPPMGWVPSTPTMGCSTPFNLDANDCSFLAPQKKLRSLFSYDLLIKMHYDHHLKMIHHFMRFIRHVQLISKTAFFVI